MLDIGDLARHDWVWLRPSAVVTAAPPYTGAVAAHIAAGQPFVVTAQRSASRHLSLGLALPDKTRVGVVCDRGAVIHHRPPPRLADVAGLAPPPKRELLHALSGMLDGVGCRAGTYGSYAWQYWTRELYVREDSDVDLLLQPGNPVMLERVLTILADFDGPALRLDGEITTAAGLAVNWRELGSEAADLLVKGRSPPVLMPRDLCVAAMFGAAP